MFGFKSLYFVIFSLILHLALGEISDKRLCVDKDCSVPIARGVTLIKYPSPEKYVLSFSPNENIVIYSFGAGSRPELIGVELKGRRGYVNKKHIRELARLKEPKLIVNTEIVKKPEVSIEVPKDEIKAAKTQEAYEIVDGTKIPIDVVASTTEIPLQKLEERQSSSEETKPLYIENSQVNDPVIQKSTEQKPQPVANVKVEDNPQAIPKDNFEVDEDDNEDDDDDLNEDDEEADDESSEKIEEEPEIEQPEINSQKPVQPNRHDTGTQNNEENLQKKDIQDKGYKEKVDLGVGSNTQQKFLDTPDEKLPDSLNTNAVSAPNTTADVPLIEQQLEENSNQYAAPNKQDTSFQNNKVNLQKNGTPKKHYEEEVNTNVDSIIQQKPLKTPKKKQSESLNANADSASNTTTDVPVRKEQLDANSEKQSPPNKQNTGTQNYKENLQQKPLDTPESLIENPDSASNTTASVPLKQNVMDNGFGKKSQDSKISATEAESSEPNSDSVPKALANVQDLPKNVLPGERESQEKHAKTSGFKKDSNISEESSPNPVTAPTEIPREDEIYYPEDFYSVTPDPAKLNPVELKEESKPEASAVSGLGRVLSMFSYGKTPDSINENTNITADSKDEGSNPSAEDTLETTVSNLKPSEEKKETAESGNIATKFEKNTEATKNSEVEASHDSSGSVGTNLVPLEEAKVKELASKLKPHEEKKEPAESGNVVTKVEKEPEVTETGELKASHDNGDSVGTNLELTEEAKGKEPVDKNGILLTIGAALQGEENAKEEVPKEDIKEPLPGGLAEVISEEDASVKNDLSFEEPPKIDKNVESSHDNNLVVETIQETDVAETHPERGNSGVFSSIFSFFGMGGNVKDIDAGKVPSEVPIDGSQSSLTEGEEKNVANNLEVGSTKPKVSSALLSESISEIAEFCESKSDKCPQIAKQDFCDKESLDCPSEEHKLKQPENRSRSISSTDLEEIFITAFSSDLFLYLTTTALSVLILIFVWTLLDKCRREGPLIARINKLEQQLLATSKENEMLRERGLNVVEEKNRLLVETVPNEVEEELNTKINDLTQAKLALEDQVAALEKELDNSTEMGMELNKIISEMLSSTDGSDILRENIEQMQKKILEQQSTINSLNGTISTKDTEIYEIRLELDISNKKVGDLQGEADKMVGKILKIEEEKEEQHSVLETELGTYQDKCKQALIQEHSLNREILGLKQSVAELQRTADIKVKEYITLKETLSKIKSMNNDKDKIRSFLDITETRAQLEQMKSENLEYSQQLTLEKEANVIYSAQIETLTQEVGELREKYEKSDKQKVEINTKLEVLNNYFKEKEDQLQKELSRYESLWAAKEGEATSTTERLRYMQEELQNYKAQNESLKKEVMNQEVELKSQISMLEKKSHENWVANRQTERKLEEARQEAAQLRNRLTMRERAFAEGNSQMRIQSPHHQNGEIPLTSPPPLLDPAQSPPPLFNPRDHIAKSLPIPGLPPPPFLPPPPLGPGHFIPPPPLDGMMPPPMGDMGMPPPPFMPGLHHPGMFPGDHRPPPLGRMSSPPPIGGRYSPESTVYSEYDRYDRRSPSPPYDSEYGASPPPIRGYSPYNDRGDRDRIRDDRREYKRPQPRSNGRHTKGMHSSGSENDSLGKVSKKPQRKV